LTSFHQTPLGSPSLLQVSTELEEAQDVLAVTRIAVAGAHCRAHRNSRSCYFRLEEVGNRLNGSIRAIAFHHAVTPRNQIRTPPIWRGDEVAPHF